MSQGAGREQVSVDGSCHYEGDIPTSGGPPCSLEMPLDPLSECPSRLAQAVLAFYTGSHVSHPLTHRHTTYAPLHVTPLRPCCAEDTASCFRFTSPNVAFLGCFAFN